jgi:hypothetical protein
LLADAAEPAAAAAIGLQLPLEQMAEQHVESAHQFPGFLASKGFQFLRQAIAGTPLIEELQRSPSPLAVTTPA